MSYVMESPEVSAFFSKMTSNEGDLWVDCAQHPNHYHHIDISDPPAPRVEWIFGINGRRKNNLVALPSGELVYSRGKVASFKQQ